MQELSTQDCERDCEDSESSNRRLFVSFQSKTEFLFKMPIFYFNNLIQLSQTARWSNAARKLEKIGFIKNY